jgi:3-dehydroquinate synthase
MTNAPRFTVALGSRSYPVVYARLSRLGAEMLGAGLPPGRALVVTDENVGALYAAEVLAALRGAGFEPHAVTVPPGEATKSAEHLGAVYSEALRWGVERSTPVVAVGGGVVGDLGGFAAATLLRGLPLVHVPTSCIAVVDSAIGGKTGINHAVGKNLIGAFHQPRLVHVDLTTLSTLPQREWTSGLAEVVKHACIADAAFFDRLEADFGAVLRRGDDALGALLPRAAEIKGEIVAGDEEEHGRRALLNFGHTFAHAIERVAGYGAFTHGEAVALGMRAALRLSALTYPALAGTHGLGRAERLVARIPVPGGVEALGVDALTEAMRSDKKVRGGAIRFVLMERLGEGAVVGGVPEAHVAEAWRHIGARG